MHEMANGFAVFEARRLGQMPFALIYFTQIIFILTYTYSYVFVYEEMYIYIYGNFYIHVYVW